MYEKTTKLVKVTVESFYLDEQSSPEDSHYLWAYQINIENSSSRTIQLINSHWKITDQNGKLIEAKGPGVVGKQPVLKPGESFNYTSGTPLNTPSGIMVGTYEMESEEGDRFEVEIPAFSLDSPYDPAILN